MQNLVKSFSLRLLQNLINTISFLCSALIMGLRPILGPALCRFEPTCTKYAIACLKELPLHKAIWVIIKRLLSCNPFTS